MIRDVPFGGAEYQATLLLREEVLRKPIGMVMRPKDTENDANEYHIAMFEAERVIGCVLLRPTEEHHVRLRQMAVAEDQQGKGIGKQLVLFALDFAMRKGFQVVDTKARKAAQGFYEKLGFSVTSSSFEEINIHLIMMEKRLSDHHR